MNFAYSRTHATQMIRHGHIMVNEKKVSIPSFLLKKDDVISFKEKAMKNENIKGMLEEVKGLVDVPGWLLVDTEKLTVELFFNADSSDPEFTNYTVTLTFKRPDA